MEKAVQNVNDDDIMGFKDTFNKVLKTKVDAKVDAVHGKKEEEEEEDPKKDDDE